MNDNSKAITNNYGQLKTLLAQGTVKQRFEEVLGQRAGQFIASILNAVYLNNNLRDCDPNSVIVAAMNAAVLDLPIDPNLGFSYIIPYRDKGIPKARFQLGYKGFLQLALRTGKYRTINATPIYEGETMDINRLTGDYSLSGKPTSETIVGYAAYMALKTGFEKTLYMTVDEVESHAKRYSKSFNMPSSPWKTHPHEMGLKTVLGLLLKRWGTLSVDVQAMTSEDEIGSVTVSGIPEFVPFNDTPIYDEDDIPDDTDI